MCPFPRYFPDSTDGLPDLNASSASGNQEVEWSLSSAGVPTMKTKAVKGKPIKSMSALIAGSLKLPAY